MLFLQYSMYNRTLSLSKKSQEDVSDYESPTAHLNFRIINLSADPDYNIKQLPNIQNIQNSVNSSKIKKKNIFDNYILNSSSGERSQCLIAENTTKKNQLQTQKRKLGFLQSQKQQIKKLKSIREMDLKNKMKKYRIDNLVKHFITKLRRTSTFRKAVIYEPFDNLTGEQKKWKGFQFHKFFLYLFYGLSILFYIANCILSTSLLFFHQQIQCKAVHLFQNLSICWILFQVCIGFLRVRQKNSKVQKYIKDISHQYLQTQFALDMVYLISVLCQNIQFFKGHVPLHLLVFMKLPDIQRKFKFLQNNFIDLLHHELIWGLAKTILTNFAVSHIIAIFLLLMSEMNVQKNWMTEKGINNADLIEQYCWALYWATTTMLTVGFGDITAANYKQAIVLVVIQSFSCMVLAYNINRIGSLLTELGQKQMEKDKRLKVLKKMHDRKQIDTDLNFKLANHIKESYKMETKFNFDEYQKFVQKLPPNLKDDLRRETNRRLIEKITFIKNFTNKTIFQLAEKLQMKIMHPWQIVCKPEMKQITILKQGQIGLCPNFFIAKYGQVVINKISLGPKQNASLITLDFVGSQQIVRNFDFKSLGYSVICTLDYKQFMEILRKSVVDAQYFYNFRDKERKNLYDFQLIQCSQCKVNHSKFICPKLHYCPVIQNVIYKHLSNVKNSKSIRKSFSRHKILISPLKQFIIDYQLDSQFEQSTHNSLKLNVKKMGTYKILKTKEFSQKLCKNQMKKEIHYDNDHQNQINIAYFAEGVKKQLIGVLQNQRNVEFWQIEMDRLKDYQFYFPQANPNKLQYIQIKKWSIKRQNNIFKPKSFVKAHF